MAGAAVSPPHFCLFACLRPGVTALASGAVGYVITLSTAALTCRLFRDLHRRNPWAPSPLQHRFGCPDGIFANLRNFPSGHIGNEMLSSLHPYLRTCPSLNPSIFRLRTNAADSKSAGAEGFIRLRILSDTTSLENWSQSCLREDVA